MNVQVGWNELTRSVHKLVPFECDNRIDELYINQGGEICYKENMNLIKNVYKVCDKLTNNLKM